MTDLNVGSMRDATPRVESTAHSAPGSAATASTLPPTGTTRMTLRDRGSMFEIVWSSVLTTQTPSTPAATPAGAAPTGVSATTRFAWGSMTATEFAAAVSRLPPPPAVSATAAAAIAAASSSAPPATISAPPRARALAGRARCRDDGASSAGSCARIARSSSCRARPGSSPSPSSSSRRASRYASSASTWRPQRYRASINCPRTRSRNGCSATSPSSSPTSPACSPITRSASIRSSSASRRSSSSRAIAPCAKPSYAKSASGGPRHNANASRNRAPAARPSPDPSARRPSATSASKRSTSTSQPSVTSAYPPPRVTTKPSPSARRRFDTYTCTVLAAVPDARSSHSASIRRSVETTSPRCNTSTASSARSFGPPTTTGRSPSTTSNGPRIRNASTAAPRQRYHRQAHPESPRWHAGFTGF